MLRLRCSQSSYLIWAIALAMTLWASGARAAEPVARVALSAELKASGLMDELLAVYKKDHSSDVTLIVSDDPIASARRGEADLAISTLGRAREIPCVNDEALFEARYEIMAREFALVGPSDDPAKAASARTAIEAAARIASKGAAFGSLKEQPVSSAIEQALWAAAGVAPQGKKWYRTDTQDTALKGRAYALVDASRWKGATGMKLLYEKDPMLTYQYSMLPVSRKKNPDAHYRQAMNLIRWIMSAQAQKGIDAFRDRAGLAPFKANAKPCNCKE